MNSLRNTPQVRGSLEDLMLQMRSLAESSGYILQDMSVSTALNGVFATTSYPSPIYPPSVPTRSISISMQLSEAPVDISPIPWREPIGMKNFRKPQETKERKINRYDMLKDAI